MSLWKWHYPLPTHERYCRMVDVTALTKFVVYKKNRQRQMNGLTYNRVILLFSFEYKTRVWHTKFQPWYRWYFFHIPTGKKGMNNWKKITFVRIRPVFRIHTKSHSTYFTYHKSVKFHWEINIIKLNYFLLSV